MFPPIQFHVRLVHAESGSRVVEVSALQGTTQLGSALGEASTAEEAEQRAIDRLLSRQLPLEESSAGAAGEGEGAPALQKAPAAPGPATPGAPPAIPGPPPAAPVPGSRTGPRLPLAPVARPLASGTAATGSAPRSEPPTAAPTPADPPADPEDWSGELARLDLELRRLGWSREQEAAYLQRAFGHPSRSRLTSYADLNAYLGALEGLPLGADPDQSPVPLRRRDLLAMSDQLLVALGWNGEQGRRFLEEQLGVASRQLLADSQLLHFNMLLEGELLERDPTGGRMTTLPAPTP